VRGGFADVTADGLTVLAEHAVALQDFGSEARLAEIETAKHALEHATSDQERLNAQMVIDVVEAL
jgi:F-type H+-transporting ATPase subunit epsilon